MTSLDYTYPVLNEEDIYEAVLSFYNQVDKDFIKKPNLKNIIQVLFRLTLWVGTFNEADFRRPHFKMIETEYPDNLTNGFSYLNFGRLFQDFVRASGFPESKTVFKHKLEKAYIINLFSALINLSQFGYTVGVTYKAYEAELDAISKENDDKKLEIERVNKDIDSKSEERIQIDKELSFLKNELTEKTSKVRSLEDQKEMLNDKIRNNSNLTKKCEEELIITRKKNQEKQEKKRTLEDLINKDPKGIRDSLEDGRQILEKKLAENEEIRETLKCLEADRVDSRKLYEQMYSMSSKVKETFEEIDKLLQVENRKQEITALKNELAIISSKVDKLREEREELVAGNQKNENESQNLKAKIKRLHQKITAGKKSHQADLYQISDQIQAVYNKFADYRQNINSLMQQMDI